MNVTEPVGTLGPGGLVAETVAVSVTGLPKVLEVGTTVRIAVEGRRPTASTATEQEAELAVKEPVGT